MGGAESRMDWKHLLASITGAVDQEIRVPNEYLVVESRILRTQITGHVRHSGGERKTLAEMGQKCGKQVLQEVASLVTPDTILAWHRNLLIKKCGGSQKRQSLGGAAEILRP